MQFFVLVILLCLFIFLFCVYSLSKDDFIFLRKDVSMERLFNLVFLGSLFCLFGARLSYGIFIAKGIFINPLSLIFFPQFPGLSLVGGLIGAILAFLYFASRKKWSLPLRRIADFYSLAFLVTLPVGFLGYLLFSQDFYSVRIIYFIVSSTILFIVFLKVLLPQLLNGKFKEGTISFLFLISFSLVYLIGNRLNGKNGQIFNFNFTSEDIVLLVIFLGSIIFAVREGNFISKIKKIKNKRG